MKKNYLWLLSVVLLLALGSCEDDPELTFNLPEVSLTSPSHGSVDVDLKPVFTWEASDPEGDDLTFDFYMGTDSLYLYKQAEGLTSPTYSLTDYNLPDSTKHYWRVVAKNSTNFTETFCWEFTTKDLD